MKSIILLVSSVLTALAAVPFDIGGPGPGSIGVTSTADSALVSWKDKAGRPCAARVFAGSGQTADHIDRSERQNSYQPRSTCIPGLDRQAKRGI